MNEEKEAGYDRERLKANLQEFVERVCERAETAGASDAELSAMSIVAPALLYDDQRD